MNKHCDGWARRSFDAASRNKISQTNVSWEPRDVEGEKLETSQSLTSPGGKYFLSEMFAMSKSAGNRKSRPLEIIFDIFASTGHVGKVKRTFCILAYLTNGWCNVVHHPISNVKFQMHLQTMVTDLPTSWFPMTSLLPWISKTLELVAHPAFPGIKQSGVPRERMFYFRIRTQEAQGPGLHCVKWAVRGAKRKGVLIQN